VSSQDVILCDTVSGGRLRLAETARTAGYRISEEDRGKVGEESSHGRSGQIFG
jgi:hypothetical protein